MNNTSRASQRKLSTPSSQKISSITPLENNNIDKSRDTININTINNNNNHKTINEAKSRKDKEDNEIKINNYRLRLNQELMKVIEEEKIIKKKKKMKNKEKKIIIKLLPMMKNHHLIKSIQKKELRQVIL